MRVPFPWFLFPRKAERGLTSPLFHGSTARTDHERWKIKGKDVPVAVNVEKEVRGANWQRELVPLSVCHPVRKSLCPRLPIMYVMIPDLIPQTTALQFKIAVCRATKTGFIFLPDITGIISPCCLLAYNHVTQNLKLVKHDTMSYIPKSMGPHGIQFTCYLRALLVTHLEPLKWALIHSNVTGHKLISKALGSVS